MKAPRGSVVYGRIFWHLQQMLALPRVSLLKLLAGLALAAGSLYVFTELVEEILEAEMQAIDLGAYQALHAWDPDWMPGLMYFITKMGSAPMAISLSLVVLAWLWFLRRNFHAIVMLLVASLGGLGLNLLLKSLLQRPRPLLDPGVDAIGWSLPSGHAMSAAIFYGFISYLVLRSRRKLKTKVLLGIPLVSFVLLIGISRIYLQAHYFSDVLAGYAAGCAWLMSCILTLEFKPWYRKHFKLEPEGHLPGDNTIPPEEVMAGQTFMESASEQDVSLPSNPVSRSSK